jgi:hypothetical protein
MFMRSSFRRQRVFVEVLIETLHAVQSQLVLRGIDGLAVDARDHLTAIGTDGTDTPEDEDANDGEEERFDPPSSCIATNELEHDDVPFSEWMMGLSAVGRLRFRAAMPRKALVLPGR